MARPKKTASRKKRAKRAKPVTRSEFETVLDQLADLEGRVRDLERDTPEKPDNCTQDEGQ